MSPASATALCREPSRPSDAELVQQCLQGREEAWSMLLARYKNLIFSIPIKYGFSQDEASDVFQSVCLDLVHELSRLRDPQALAGWLIRVTHNKCYHQKQERTRFIPVSEEPYESAVDPAEMPEDLLQQVQKEQCLRGAIGELSPRCQELVEKLFFQFPSRPYQQVASELGLAVGSIGFIRRRCLDKLRDRLESLGVK